ncbi:TPA: zinc-binding dehydrogenase [Pseudomonas aeruginosa]|nr:zinc-binding dehydrogenase [Pseudomonas aeruginosa]
MKGWQLTEFNEPLQLVELPDPTPRVGQIVVNPVVTGICHTDIGYHSGTLARALGQKPIILGHEIAGVVSAIGEGVTQFAVGDRVAIRSGSDAPGSAMHGGFANKVLTPVEFVARIPEGVPFEHAAVATDAGLTAYHAVQVAGRVSAGMKVGIIGLGGLGYFGAQIAAAAGAQVYAAERNAEARASVSEFGYARIVSDVVELAGEELDVIVDFAGFETTTSGAIEAVRKGGRVVQVGVGRAETTIPTLILVMKEVELVGSLAGTVEDLEVVLALLAEGKLKPLVSTIGFNEVPEGLARLDRGEVRGRLAVRIDL